MPSIFAALATLLRLALAQLADQSEYPVGPLTSISAKSAVNTCDVTDYGAVADSSIDIGPALTSAFEACSGGGVVYVPPGNYSMSTFVTFSSVNAWALNLEGTIFRSGSTSSGNMIAVSNCTDFEFYSGNGQGAIQGYGYEFLENETYGPRLVRFTDVTSFAMHDIALVDSPAFHLVLDTCQQGEVYNMVRWSLPLPAEPGRVDLLLT
jgi:rhamnogalacturonan hydrolase